MFDNFKRFEFYYVIKMKEIKGERIKGEYFFKTSWTLKKQFY